MKKFAIPAVLMAGLATAGCTTTDQDNAVIGGAAGAAIGGIATGNVKGAAVGAAIGAGTGVLLGRVAEGSSRCYYKDRYGRKYIARCR